MENIIYKSDNIIPWDTQSAFKMTNYSGTCEENLIFCYFKAYIRENNLIMCSYTFVENPHGKNSLCAVFEFNSHIVKVVYGYEGIDAIIADGEKINTDCIKLSVFKADDEQGFYWCGELTLTKEFIKKYGVQSLCEGEKIGMNLIQVFENGEWGAVYCKNDEYESITGEFLILDY